jgi:cytochrome bd-type quinol oxidase subunit 2
LRFFLDPDNHQFYTPGYSTVCVDVHSDQRYLFVYKSSEELLSIYSAKMGFELWKDPIQFAQFIVLIIFSPLGVILTMLRVMATRRSSRKVAFEDWMALVAAFFTVMTNVAGLAGM